MPTTTLLAILLSLQPFSGDSETTDQREARLGIVSDAISGMSERASCTGSFAKDEGCSRVWDGSPKELAMLLVTIGYHETHFSKRIHEGRCLVGECDGGAARGLWQLHQSSLCPWKAWSQITDASPKATRLGAYSAAAVLGLGARKCKGSIEGAISIYATGSSCTWKGAKARMSFFKNLMSKEDPELVEGVK